MKPKTMNYAGNIIHDFNNLFHDKAITVRNDLLFIKPRTYKLYVKESCPFFVEEFFPVSAGEIKQFQDGLNGLVTKTVNTSFPSVMFPLPMKSAILKLV